MKIFSRTPTAVESAEAVLTKARDRRNRIAAQLADAERELAQWKAAAADAALSENAELTSDLASDVATAQATHEALATALANANAEVGAAETALAAARDAEQRAASVAELTELIDQIEAASVPFSSALADLLAPLQRGAEVSPDCKSVYGFFELLRSDVAQMLENATGALGIHARNIEGRSAPARLPKLTPTPVAMSAPSPTTTMVPLFDVRWTDSAGTIRFASRGWDAPLPIAAAQRALVAGIVVPADSPEAIKARRERGSPNPGPDAVDLDQANPVPPPPPPEKWIRPFAAKWEMPTGSPPRAWIAK